ncbi:TBPIP-domain-containing protein [Neoconidiobolus thromboides FSU 785]|nr:TBPIP-domain-containing protein [Neoconidiobolus thromboides FSU 785]
MAVKKKLVNGLDGEEADEHILNYMKLQNRPYGINDIVNNLADKISKATIQKAIAKLALEDKLISKTYNKTVIYCIKQEDEDKPSEKEMEDIENENERLSNVLKQEQELNKELDKEYKKYANLEPIDKIESDIKLLNENINNLNNKIEKINNLLNDSSENEYLNEAPEIQTQFAKYKNLYVNRKKLFYSIINKILENSDKKMSEFMDEINLEDDSMLNINFYEILKL